MAHDIQLASQSYIQQFQLASVERENHQTPSTDYPRIMPISVMHTSVWQCIICVQRKELS